MRKSLCVEKYETLSFLQIITHSSSTVMYNFRANSRLLMETLFMAERFETYVDIVEAGKSQNYLQKNMVIKPRMYLLTITSLQCI